jgi:hypothetical protein
MTQTANPTPSQADGGTTSRPEAGSEGTASLDALLQEFEGKKPEAKPAPDISGALRQLQPVIDFAQTEMTTRRNEVLKEDIATAIKSVKEADEAKEIPDRVIRGLLEVRATDDPSFREAWGNRHRDPETWKTKLADARKDIAAEVKGLTASTVQSDVIAARASISGTARQPESGPKYDPVKLLRMSDQEFASVVAEAKAQSAR